MRLGSTALATERVERRLAAILAADVVGYSRLIGADEAGTLAAFKTIKSELFDPTSAANDGRLVKTTGDGFLVGAHKTRIPRHVSGEDSGQLAFDAFRGQSGAPQPHGPEWIIGSRGAF